MKKITLAKQPFVRILPMVSEAQVIQDPLAPIPVDDGASTFLVIPQSEFIRELNPSGHKILDENYYPDKYVYDDSDKIKQLTKNGKGTWIKMPVYRYTTPLQAVILIKQLGALCGEPIALKDTSINPGAEKKKLLQDWKQQWKDRNMEEKFYQCAKSEKITGDAALVFFFDAKGRINCRPLSYLDGSTLYEFKDENNEENNSFARTYNLVNADNKTESHIEYWDSRYFYRFTKVDKEDGPTMRTALAESMGFDGYSLDEGFPKQHGFPICPVAYKRNMYGACWSLVQYLIDQYEMNMSLLGENNKATAFSIMYLLGEDAEIQGGVDGRPYAITSSNPDTKVGMLSQPHESENFSLMLKTSLEQVLMGSFTVVPPEVKSGDLSGIAVKLIFSPSLELASTEAKEWNPFIDKVVYLFNYGLGIEMGKPSDYKTLSVHGEIIPHIHQNTSEVITNLCQGVLNGILSVETAIERNPYSAPDEKSRVEREHLLENIQENNIVNDGMNEYNRKNQKTE